MSADRTSSGDPAATLRLLWRDQMPAETRHDADPSGP